MEKKEEDSGENKAQPSSSSKDASRVACSRCHNLQLFGSVLVQRKTIIYHWVFASLADFGPTTSLQVANTVRVSNAEVMMSLMEINKAFPEYLTLIEMQGFGPLLITSTGNKMLANIYTDLGTTIFSEPIPRMDFFNKFSKRLAEVALHQEWVDCVKFDDGEYIVTGGNKEILFQVVNSLFAIILGKTLPDDTERQLKDLALVTRETFIISGIDRGPEFPRDRNDVATTWLRMMVIERTKYFSLAPPQPNERRNDASTSKTNEVAVKQNQSPVEEREIPTHSGRFEDENDEVCNKMKNLRIADEVSSGAKAIPTEKRNYSEKIYNVVCEKERFKSKTYYLSPADGDDVPEERIYLTNPGDIPFTTGPDIAEKNTRDENNPGNDVDEPTGEDRTRAVAVQHNESLEADKTTAVKKDSSRKQQHSKRKKKSSKKKRKSSRSGKQPA